MEYKTLSLEAKDLSYSYSTIDTPIFCNLSHIFYSGKIYAIIGPSGAGKSTLLRVLSGLNQSSTGEISIKSTSRFFSPHPSLYHNTSFLSQDDMLFSWRSVEENIRLPLQLGLSFRDTNESQAIIEESLRLFHLTPYRNFFPKELSGGLKKLTALARSYVENRPILLLDEPFSSVDVFLRRELYHLIQTLAYSFGKLIIYVTHDLYDCEKLSDEILFFSDGILIPNMTITALAKMRETYALSHPNRGLSCEP